uniref:Uncharacterized protein n=1 Tax=Mustela putorius furo TaxID=9669 RepID=M3YM86_MUSPF
MTPRAAARPFAHWSPSLGLGHPKSLVSFASDGAEPAPSVPPPVVQCAAQTADRTQTISPGPSKFWSRCGDQTTPPLYPPTSSVQSPRGGRQGARRLQEGKSPLTDTAKGLRGQQPAPTSPSAAAGGGGSEPEGRGARTSEPAHRRRRGPDAGKGRPPGPGGTKSI